MVESNSSNLRNIGGIAAAIIFVGLAGYWAVTASRKFGKANATNDNSKDTKAEETDECWETESMSDGEDE